MTDQHTAKQKLEAEKAELTATLSTLGIQNPANPSDWITITKRSAEAEENTVADQQEAYLNDRGTLAELETRYSNVTHALEKIASGTFGTCEVCGTAIEADRLHANAAARTCKAHLASHL